MKKTYKITRTWITKADSISEAIFKSQTESHVEVCCRKLHIWEDEDERESDK